MTELSQITDHVERGLAHLIEQYKGRPRIEALLRSYLLDVQELEDAIWGVIVGRLLDNAVDAQLDTLGRLVGQERQGEEDDRYRILIRARIGVNRSDGKAFDLLNITTVILDGISFSMTELFPASIVIDIPEECDFADLVFAMLSDARAAGVDLTVHWFDGHDEEDAFLWASGDDFEEDADRGFGGDDPETGDGGLLIGAF